MSFRSMFALTLVCVALGSCTRPCTLDDPAARDGAQQGARSRRRIWAVLINGGGNKEKNYQSHLLHVRGMLDFLIEAGVRKRRIDVFTGDGTDPAPDLAVRDATPVGNFRLIRDLPIGRMLAGEIHYENTQLNGVRVHSATTTALDRWRTRHARRLRPGDSLFLYVTDHGGKNTADLDNNYIVLWGERWSVAQFRRFLDGLRPGVRVVSLMSQCFSGSFANAMYAPAQRPRVLGDVCGYFSSSPARPAYGCYPENLGRNNVGHSFRFLEALRADGNLKSAQSDVTVNDRTPDVPNRTTDLLLHRTLEREAERQEKSFRRFADELLHQAWRDEIHFRPLFEAVDAIGAMFSMSTPRTLSDSFEQSADLPKLARELRDHAQRWKTALNDLERDNFLGFLDAHPFWRPYLTGGFLAQLSAKKKRQLSRWLLADLGSYTSTDNQRSRPLETMQAMSTEASAAAYRMQVRLAAGERMRQLLIRIAALVYLDRYGTNEERRDYEALSACEDFRISPPGRRRKTSTTHRLPFPSLAEEAELVETVRPGWLGIQYKPVSAEARANYNLAPGAVTVSHVLPESPAEAAGILDGDLILGPPDRPFQRPNQLREWVMTALIGSDRELTILRAGTAVAVVVRVGAAPL